MKDRSSTPSHFKSPASPGLVVIAASADGLVAISAILSKLPADFPIPIAIVLHRGETSISDQILARRSKLQVKNAEEGERLSPGTVYLAPPRRHLVLRGNRKFHLMDGRQIKHLYSSANPLFESAAHAMKGRVIAVVLTGSGTDATDGVQTVKKLGGIVIAQDPVSATFVGMPAAAIATGVVDRILPLDDIPNTLVRLVMNGSGCSTTLARDAAPL